MGRTFIRDLISVGVAHSHAKLAWYFQVLQFQLSSRLIDHMNGKCLGFVMSNHSTLARKKILDIRGNIAIQGCSDRLQVP